MTSINLTNRRSWAIPTIVCLLVASSNLIQLEAVNAAPLQVITPMYSAPEPVAQSADSTTVEQPDQITQQPTDKLGLQLSS